MKKECLKFTISLLLALTGANFIDAQTTSDILKSDIRKKELKIVILGSSTAQGSGPSKSDSAWVNRYRKHIHSIYSEAKVINLAKGGYTTYQIMGSCFVAPLNRPKPDFSRNISEALRQKPDAIIVNMPSNDVSSGYSVEEQLGNLNAIVALAHSHLVPIWICTTQPKNHENKVRLQLQYALKDSIEARYAPKTIDFWTDLAVSDFSIDPKYDSGDGTHLNDAAHAILAQRVIDANIPNHLFLTLPQKQLEWINFWMKNQLFFRGF